MRKGFVAVAGAVAMVAALAACGGHDRAEPTISGETPVAPVPGKFVGECGSASDGDVAQASGLTGVRLVTRNPLRCRWETGTGGGAVDFAWFRSSTLADHHPAGTTPAASTVDLAGRRATVWQGANSCEVAVPSGGVDFISWTVDDAARPGAQLCDNAERLVSQTVAKAP